jgi:hypothetical protein
MLTGKSQEIRLYASGLESAKKAAKTIVLFLTQRSVLLVVVWIGISKTFVLDPGRARQPKTPMKLNTVPFLII